ncbi:hypothetical protein CCY99_09080 [Helicobacter sp. 16-1353]|uniref:phosphopantetheine-binding protein n=1 Tax=Helicobacter sp. 16-1353 TaxID=2004996 RepID=UPI000DCC5D02|nr:phosphopantetheine-binding protein [Helicobacter sp. 16-1353]RAX51423.1 hypothetical protein CCY99_09080 [Helicobacter sp. 16-1353]
MTKEELLLQLQDALQKDDALNENDELDSLEEWDSLAIISIINLYEILFNIKISGNKLKECKTIADILSLAPINSSNGK